MPINYTNPRREAEFDDWPYGSNRKTVAQFGVERDNKRGERTWRKTLNPRTGGFDKPKYLTYSVKQRIVDGTDGKTYVLCLTMYGGITVMQSNMQYTAESIDHADVRFEALNQMMKEA